MDIKLCSLNVNGLGNKCKREKIFSWIKQNNFSICFMQELHCTLENNGQWEKQWGNDLFLSGNSSNSTGIGIFLNLNCPYDVIEHNEIIQGRLQLLKINLLNNTTLTLINIYGPNNDDLHFFATVEKTITENSSETMILGGDFNNVLNYELDKLNGNSSTIKKCSSKINDIITNNDLCDIYRLRYPDTKRYTWHSNHRPPIFCRLDTFLSLLTY